MALIFDLQTHPVSGVIFDAQEYTRGFGTSDISLTPQATTSVGRILDTDLQTVVYPQAQLTYAPSGTAYLVNGAVQTSFTPAAAIVHASASAAYTVNGAGAIVLTPVGVMAYAPIGSNAVNGSVVLSFTPLAQINYVGALVGSGVPVVILQLGSTAEKKRRKKSVDEKTSAVLTIKFYDRGGVAVVPLSALYQVDNQTTGTAVRVETALPAAAQIVLTLTAADNAIVDQSNVRELRRVTVEATLPGGDTVNAQYDYLVRNLSGVI